MRNVTVGWTPHLLPQHYANAAPITEMWKLVSFIEPEPMLQFMLREHRTYEFKACPSYTKYFENAFLVRSPIDITIRFNEENKTCHIEHQNQEFYDKYVICRYDVQAPGDKLLVSLHMGNLFVCDEDVDVESLGLPIVGKLPYVTHIVGSFNIHKWVRPIDWTFAVEDQSKPIVVKRGDPLYMVRFVPHKYGTKVNLRRMEYSEKHALVAAACTTSRIYNRKVSLADRYEAAKALLKNIKWNKK